MKIPKPMAPEKRPLWTVTHREKHFDETSHDGETEIAASDKGHAISDFWRQFPVNSMLREICIIAVERKD